MGRSCIHFTCRFCGSQQLCLDSALGSDDLLVCSRGHAIFLKEEDRQKINLAFKGFVETRIDVFV